MNLHVKRVGLLTTQEGREKNVEKRKDGTKLWMNLGKSRRSELGRIEILKGVEEEDHKAS